MLRKCTFWVIVPINDYKEIEILTKYLLINLEEWSLQHHTYAMICIDFFKYQKNIIILVLFLVYIL